MNRYKASLSHFLISLTVLSAALLVVFTVWYPNPFFKTNSVYELVKILIIVDLVLGPLLTLIIFNTGKAWPVLRRDLLIIGCVQVAALGYGMYSMYMQRPQYVVFAVDRYEVFAGIDVDESPLPNNVKKTHRFGPQYVFADGGKTRSEKAKIVAEFMDGKGSFSQRRERYRPLEQHLPELIANSIEVNALAEIPANLSRGEEIEKLRKYAAVHSTEYLLPVTANNKSMIGAFDPQTGVLSHAFHLYPFTESSRETAKTPPRDKAVPTKDVSGTFDSE